MALLFSTIWAAAHAHEHIPIFSYLIGFGIPAVGYVLKASGAPATLLWNEGLRKFLREERNVYNLYHGLWHYVSGFGCFLVPLYFSIAEPNQHLGGGELWGIPNLPKAPLICYLVSILLNVVGNALEFMPVD